MINHTNHLRKKVIRQLVPVKIAEAIVPQRGAHRELLERITADPEDFKPRPTDHSIPIFSKRGWSWSTYPSLYSTPIPKGHLITRSYGGNNMAEAAAAFIGNDGVTTLINPDIHAYARDMLFELISGGKGQITIRDQTHSPLFPVRLYNKQARKFQSVGPGTKLALNKSGTLEILEGPRDYYIATDRKISFRAGKMFRRLGGIVEAKQLMLRQVPWHIRKQQLMELDPKSMHWLSDWMFEDAIPQWVFSQMGLTGNGFKLRYLQSMVNPQEGQYFKPDVNLDATRIIKKLMKDENDNTLPLLASFAGRYSGLNWRNAALAAKGAYYLKARD